jgi:hypothetical protein
MFVPFLALEVEDAVSFCLSALALLVASLHIKAQWALLVAPSAAH